MALDALLARFEGRAVTPVTADAMPDVTPKPAPMLACTPVTAVTAPPANWHSLHARYMVHHWRCAACIAGGQGRGERCGPGVAMWAAYAGAVGARGAAWLSEAFEERAAIMEFDGGMRRFDAEATARLELPLHLQVDPLDHFKGKR